MHQRRLEHVQLLDRALPLQEGGYGHPHGRPGEPGAAADQAEYSARHELVG